MKNFPWSRRPERRTVQVATLVISLLLLLQPVVWGQSAPSPVPPGADAAKQQTTDEGPASTEWYLTLPPVQPGFPVALSGAYLNLGSSPTLADLDGNGTLEVIIAGRDLDGGSPGDGGMVYVYRHNGSLLWQKHVRAPINSTPTTADLTGDGTLDVVVSMGGVVEPQAWNGGVIALNGVNGAELWTFDTQDWLNHHPDGWRDGVFSTPAIADINGDGQLEITFGAWDQCIYLLDRNGNPLWGNLPGILPETYCGGHGFYNEDTIWSSPALADLNNDGRYEIIVGADISPGNVWGDPGGGYLYVFDADGNALAREWMDQVVFSSPAVADLDNDGDWEVVVGTGTYWENKGYYVSAFDFNQAAAHADERLVLKWRKSTAGRVFASPAIADLNQDGVLDVVITSPIGDFGIEGSILYAWRGSDGSPMIQRRICNFQGMSQNTLSSPTVADVDGDAHAEILISHAWEVAIFNHDGTYYTDYSNPKWPGGPENPACARDHVPTTELSYYVEYSLYASPAVGDLDGDGDVEIVIGGHNPANPNQGMIFAWTGHSKRMPSPWATWRHDEYHTGNHVFELIPPSNPTSLSSPSHTPGTWSSSNTIQVSWSGAQDAESGLGGYSVVWDTSPTTLPDTTLDLGAAATGTTSPPLADGKAHYFHLRTGDRAGNWTATALHLGPFWIDSMPPQSAASSPQVATGSFQVTWQGSDSASGLAAYTIQVRDGDGPWTNWLANQTATSATYQGATGHVYHFRSIARDAAGNEETDYTSSGDTSTAVARFLLGGTIYDQREQPVSNASVSAQPAALSSITSESNGQFALPLADGGTYDVTASHAGYGSLPPLKGVVVDSNVAGVDLYLPPRSNQIQNGDFESSGDWALDGPVSPSPAKGTGHTGDYALQMGDLPNQPAPPQTWTASQTVVIPSNASEATLDWFYRVEGRAASDDELLVRVQGPSAEISQPLSLGATAWTHEWIDVTKLAGQEVTITFVLSRKTKDTPLTVWLDEVGLGGEADTYIFLPQILRNHAR